jgi:hypothetical protein
MIDCKNVDSVVADHVVHAIWKATHASTSYARIMNRVDLGLTADPIEAGVD